MDVVMQPDRLAAVTAAQIAPLKELTPPPQFSFTLPLNRDFAFAPEAI
jgi:hypothetical protein